MGNRNPQTSGIDPTLVLLSSSYQLQCRKVNRMCLAENAQHTKKYLNTHKSGFALIKPFVNCFVHRYSCFVFQELNRFLAISVRNPRKISSSVLENSKLDPQNSTPRSLKIENSSIKNSILDSRKTLRIEKSSFRGRDCQLTFERYCTCRN